MKSKDVLKLLNVTRQTLTNYVNQGLIRFTKINKVHYIYNDEDIYKLIGLKKEKKNKTNVSYSRVSTQSQREQLKEQTIRIYESCIKRGLNLEKQFEEIKSGMEGERKVLNEIISLIIKGEVDILVICHSQPNLTGRPPSVAGAKKKCLEN